MTPKYNTKTQITLTRSEKSLVRQLLLLTEDLSDKEWRRLQVGKLKLTHDEAVTMDILRRKLGLDKRRLD